METLYQLLCNKKFRVVMFYVFMSSLLVAFVFSTYILLSTIDTINDRYHDARIRHQRLYGDQSRYNNTDEHDNSPEIIPGF